GRRRALRMLRSQLAGRSHSSLEGPAASVDDEASASVGESSSLLSRARRSARLVSAGFLRKGAAALLQQGMHAPYWRDCRLFIPLLSRTPCLSCLLLPPCSPSTLRPSARSWLNVRVGALLPAAVVGRIPCSCRCFLMM